MNKKFAFFGTPLFSKIILDHLEKCGFVPSLIICAPDKPKGRGLELHEPETKVWAKERNVPVMQPQKLNDEIYDEIQKIGTWDFFIVAAYGKIIAQRFLDLPLKGSINVHPSLLPKYRGPSPLQAQILSDEKDVGTTIMLMDALMDHGPILSQKIVDVEMPMPFPEFLEIMANESGPLLCETLPEFLNGNILPQEQPHESATACKMIKKEDGLTDISGNPRENYLKFLALNPWPGTYFFVKKNDRDIRVKITDASFYGDKFVIKKIIPEGKHEMNFDDFKRNI